MSWEFSNKSQMYQVMVGNFYGAAPEGQIDEISRSRRLIANDIASKLNITSISQVLELGSGSGLMAHHLSPNVKKYYCTDISRSFLNVAQEQCKFQSNVSFHLLNAFQFDFVENQTLDSIFAHAVFIHLNLYDFYLYLEQFSRMLKIGGKVYLDFLSADNVIVESAPLFREHVEFYRNRKNALPTLLQYNSEKAVEKIARFFGLEIINIWRGPNNSVAILLEKIQPSVAGRKTRVESALSFYRESLRFYLCKLKIFFGRTGYQ